MSPLPWLYNYNTVDLDNIEIDQTTQINEENYYSTTSGQVLKKPSPSLPIRSHNLIKKRSIKRATLFGGSKKIIRTNSRQEVYNSNNLKPVNNNIDDFDKTIKLNNIQAGRKKPIWNTLRYKAKNILPTVRDINIIDKYSRVIFPSLFLLFNICYWCFYFVQSTYIYNIQNNLH